MTSITAPAALSVSLPATRLRITARGRRVLAAVVAAPLALAIAWAALGGGAAVASREQGAPLGSFQIETVAPGETLWSIAERVAPAADPRDVVDAIARLNALDSSLLTVGQELAIPAEYTAGGK